MRLTFSPLINNFDKIEESEQLLRQNCKLVGPSFGDQQHFVNTVNKDSFSDVLSDDIEIRISGSIGTGNTS